MNNRESNRFLSAVQLVNYDYKYVLDVGCRDKVLKTFLKKDVNYQGIDMKDSQEVLGHDLENGIPFPDKSFDVTFALDVLEHVVNIHFLLEEIIRVSKYEAVVALPNSSYWKLRLRYLKGKDIGNKYILCVDPCLDRHRWLTSYNSSVKFIKYNASNYDITIVKEYYQYTSKLLRWVDVRLGEKWPNLFVHTMIFRIRKNQ